MESSKERDEVVDAVYDVFAKYCRDNDITEDDISTPMLEQIAEGVVERGLGVPVSEETELNDKVWEAHDGE